MEEFEPQLVNGIDQSNIALKGRGSPSLNTKSKKVNGIFAFH